MEKKYTYKSYSLRLREYEEEKKKVNSDGIELRGLRKRSPRISGNARYLGGRKMNYMPKVLEMLGVEVNETFKIKGFNLNPYQFDEEYNLIDMEFYVRNGFIRGLIIGKYEIEKLPWKPKKDEVYYVINFFGNVVQCRWLSNNINQYYRYNAGNCFKTKEEITEEIKQRILQEMKGKYEND